MLNKQCTEIGYLLGRLFALVEYGEPHGRKHNIGKWCRLASTQPHAIFANLLEWSALSCSRMQKSGGFKRKLADYIEAETSAICEDISIDSMPAHLNSDQRGNFVVGMSHQKLEIQRQMA